MNLIDADRLKAVIEEWYNAYKIGSHSVFRSGKIEALRETIELIDSLQQKQLEVDLEKDIEKICDFNKAQTLVTMTKGGLRAAAYHFYELGLNARKDK